MNLSLSFEVSKFKTSLRIILSVYINGVVLN